MDGSAQIGSPIPLTTSQKKQPKLGSVQASTGSAPLDIKVIDLGSSAPFAEGLVGLAGATAHYAAPEVLLRSAWGTSDVRASMSTPMSMSMPMP